MVTNNSILSKLTIMLAFLCLGHLVQGQQYASAYEKTKAKVVTAAIKQLSNERRLLEGNHNGDTSIENGIPQYSVSGFDQPDRLSTQTYNCFPSLYEGCWWYVSNGVVNQYYDDLVTVVLNTNVEQAVIRIYSPQDSLLSELILYVRGDLYPLSPGSILSGSQSISSGDVPQTITAQPSAGGICDSMQFQWQYGIFTKNEPDTYYDMTDETNPDSVSFSEPQNVSIAVRRRVICGEDTAYTASVIISVSNPISEFHPGYITSEIQIIPRTSIPDTITATPVQDECGTATYVWESSTDGVNFIEISGENQEALSFTEPLGQETFFRRKATSPCTSFGYTNTVYVAFLNDSIVSPPPPVLTEIDSILLASASIAHSIFNFQNDSLVNFHIDGSAFMDSLSKVQALNEKLVMIDNYSQAKLTPDQISGIENASMIDDIGKMIDNEKSGGSNSDTTPIFVPLITDSMLQYYKDSSLFDQLDSTINSFPKISFHQAFSTIERQLQDSFKRDDTLFLNEADMRQSVRIQGPVIIKYNDTASYTAAFYFPLGASPDIRWVVKGGTIIYSNTNINTGIINVKIRWTSKKDIPFVAVVDVASKQYNSMEVIFRPQPSTAYPIIQYGYYNQQLADINASSCIAQLPAGYTTEYQWQSLDFYGDNEWVDVPSATNETLGDVKVIAPLTGYRRITTVKTPGNTIACQSTSTIAWIVLRQVYAVTFSYTTNVEYNTAPQFFAFPAFGGMLVNAASYQYTWEASENGGPWTEIGQGMDYPTSYTIHHRSVSIRQVVKIIDAPSNIYAYPEKFWKYIGFAYRFTFFYKTVDYENRNYIRENSVLTRGIDNWEDADLLPVDKKMQTTTYLDGLSRPIQVVGKGVHYDEASNSWFDMVKNITYEAGGRVDKSFLPYPTTTTPGKYKTNAATEQVAFYQTEFNDNTAYAKVEYDNSPLNRVKKAFAPGDSWGGAGINVAGDIEPYNAEDNVKYFTIDYDNNDGTYAVLYTAAVSKPVYRGNYPNLQLIKTVGIDEKGKKVITYTDKKGNVILKKVQLADGAALSGQHAGWLCNYYIYDDFNQLRFTITPKAVTELENNNWNLNTTQWNEITNNLCFWYRYDNLGRLIVKKTPGKGVEQIAYDNRNRVVAVNDAGINERGYASLITLYDDLNRPVMTGLLYDTKLYQIAEEMAAASGVVNVIQAKEGGYIRVWGSSLTQAEINNDNDFKQLSFTYYDDYGYVDAKSFDASHITNLGYQNTSTNGDVDPNTKTQRHAGMVTGSRIRVLTTGNQFLTSSVFYDEEGRAVQSLEDNIAGGVEITSTQYHFDGRVLSTKGTHNMPGTSYSNFTTLTKYKFDKSGRVSGIAKKINDAARSYVSNSNMDILEDADAGYKIIATYKYNKLGRRVKKTLAPQYNNNQGLETLEYSYNIRGWLTGINKDYALNEYNSSQWQHYFGMYLGYANADGKFAAAQYNGSITGVLWKSQGDNTPRKFDYEYDNANRLTKAVFNQRGTSNESWNRLKVDFSTKNISYDENGNILSMVNMGVLIGAAAPVAIDDLTYTYEARSNRLMRVDDAAGSNSGQSGDFKDGSNSAGTDDYHYDLQGRLTLDNNKRISEIKYNYLDKPDIIKVDPPVGSSTGGGHIRYIYDAAGNKQQKIVLENPTPQNGNQQITITTTYVANYIYTQVTTYPASGGNSTVGATQLQMILHEEGRIRIITPYENSNDPTNVISGGIPMPDNKQGVFDYFIKDNLGNVRATITEEINKASSICTMEIADAAVKAKEESIFGNPGGANEVINTRVDRPTAWESGTHPPQTLTTNTHVSELFALNGQPVTGPNALLRVMAGDEVSGYVDYYYDDPNPGAGNSYGVPALVNSLLSALNGGRADVMAHGTDITNSIGNNTDISSFFDNPAPGSESDNTVPRAYLNYIFFDEQFNFIGQTSGYKRVTTGGDGATPLVFTNVKAVKNGYVYVYLSNESSTKVYFDNFTVTHNRGQLLAEDHYYAYGLKITAISSKAVSSSLNPLLTNYGYQGSFSEEVEEFDLNYNEFFYRTYDPQIGRWTSVDPYDEFPNPYTGLGNDPVNNIDPTGGFLGLSGMQTMVLASAVGGFVGAIIDLHNGGDGGMGFIIGASIGLIGGGILATSNPAITLTRSLIASVAISGVSIPPTMTVIVPPNVDMHGGCQIPVISGIDPGTNSPSQSIPQDPFEEIVRQSIVSDGDFKHTEALQLMLEHYPIQFNVSPKYYDLHWSQDATSHITNYPQIPTRDNDKRLKCPMMLSAVFFSLFASHPKSELFTFSFLLRSIYHEMIHVKDYLGLDGHEKLIHSDEMEFRAHYESYNDPTSFPAATDAEKNARYRFVVYGDGKGQGNYYQKMLKSAYYQHYSEVKKALYKRWYEQMKQFVDEFEKAHSKPKKVKKQKLIKKKRRK